MPLVRRNALWLSVLVLLVAGVILLAITADEGGYRLYHPYAIVALVAFAAAAVLTATAVWRFVRQHWQA